MFLLGWVSEVERQVGTFLLLLISVIFLWRQRQKHRQAQKSSPGLGVSVDSDRVVSYCPSADSIELPNRPHVQFCCVPYTGELNPDGKVYHYENDFVKGTGILLQRATWDPVLDRSGDHPFAYVFKGRKIKWDCRIQVKFKKEPVGAVQFGIELDEYVPTSTATKLAMKVVVAALKLLVGNDLYHSVGEDPLLTEGEAERPVFAMPIWAFDQVIVTPEGEAPPSVTDPNFAQLGLRRKDDKEFGETMRNMKFKPGPTYTISFHSISSLLDIVLWKISGAVPGMAVDMDTMAGRPPIHVVMYTLEPPPPNNQSESRHIDSRKNYIFHVALWSSLRQPPNWRLKQLMPTGTKMLGHGLNTIGDEKESRRCCFYW